MKRKRQRQRGLKLGSGKDERMEEEGEAHEMGEVVDGIFTVGSGEGEGQNGRSGEGEMVDVPLH